MQRREFVVPKDMKNIHERFRYLAGVKAGPLLYMAGQVGRDENLNVVEGKEAQFVQAFENVKKVLTEAGITFDDGVDMVTYHTDMSDLQPFMKVKDQYFTNLDCLPTWTAIGATALAMPGLFVVVTAGHSSVKAIGTSSGGGRVSRTVIVCTALVELPHESVAVQRRAITLVLAQLVVTTSL